MDSRARIEHMRVMLDGRDCGHRHDPVLQHLEEIERDMDRLLAIAARGDRVPARLKVTVWIAGNPIDLKGIPMSNPQIPLGTRVGFTAHVANAEAVELPDAPVTWSTDNGTVATDPAVPSGHSAILVNATLGTANVTAMTANGITVVTPVDIVDDTPATMTVDVAALPAAA